VLGLDGQSRRLVLREIGRLPQPLEQIEAKMVAQRLLDDLAVAAAGASRPHL
jgi:hypothetical protein